MRENADSGRTILFVSHNLTAVQTFCNKVLSFEKGRLVEQGEINQIITSYLSKLSAYRPMQHWATPEEAPGND